MARPLNLEGPNTLEDVEAAYRAATSRREFERLFAVRMALHKVMGLRGIAQAVRRGRSTIKRWLAAFREGGIAGLLYEPMHKGKHPTPSVRALVELEEGLFRGRWQTLQQIRTWLEEEHQVELSLGGVYYWLGRLRASLKVPQTSHVEKDPAEVEAFKEDFEHDVKALVGPKGKTKKVYIWVEDEHRYGLNTVTRRVWTLTGYRPVVPYQMKRKYADLYGALEVGTGTAEFLHVPSVSLQWTNIFYHQLVAVDPDGIHVVISDQAGWHPLPGDPSLPEQIRTLPLPAHSPELNPAEGLWPEVKKAAANAVWKALSELERVIDAALYPFQRSAARVCRLLGKHWTTRAAIGYLKHPCGAIPN